MKHIAIVIAKTQGALGAALVGTGYQMIVGTERQFDSLTTFSDGPSTRFGYVDTNESGWMALAEY